MEVDLSLREWAKNNEIWEPESWKKFLKNDLVPFYKCVFTLNELYEFLKSDLISGKSSLSDIEDDKLRDKIRVAIYGGVEPGKNSNMSFAKSMYNVFGMSAENVSSFEESIKQYENWGDSVKININPNSLINSIPIKKLMNDLRQIIDWDFCSKFNIEFNEIGLQELYPNPPIEFPEPSTLLPQSTEEPEKLFSLINDFRQKALSLSISVNPFMTFIFYTRVIPLSMLISFLNCDIYKITPLANFLGLKAYSMIDESEISLPTKSPDKGILFSSNRSLSNKILNLQYFLTGIDSTIGINYNKMVQEAVNQIHVSFEPWEDYEPIFLFLYEIQKKSNSFSLVVENGKIIKIWSPYKELILSNKIWLRDLLIRLSPAVSTGIFHFSHSMTDLEFSNLSIRWIINVMESERKS